MGWHFAPDIGGVGRSLFDGFLRFSAFRRLCAVTQQLATGERVWPRSRTRNWHLGAFRRHSILAATRSSVGLVSVAWSLLAVIGFVCIWRDRVQLSVVP